MEDEFKTVEKPVSYTHLDVYKRQYLSREIRRKDLRIYLNII